MTRELFKMNFSNDNVCAVVVTYFPGSGFAERLRIISEQAKHVIIVDNSSTVSAPQNLNIALRGKINVELIKNNVNLGVAAALNQGVRKGLGYGYSWIVTFDQDSVPQQNMVKKMLEVWEAYPKSDQLMIMGPKIIFPNCSPKYTMAQEAKPCEAVSHVITSGSLISKRAFELVGFFDSNLCIDYVDIEYCLRLRSRGYEIVQVRDAILIHSIGNIIEHSFFGENVHPTYHNPVRRYYQFRNALLLHKVYKETQSEWYKHNRIVLLKIICLILLYEKRRLSSLLQIVKGVLHGLSGRAGRRGEIVWRPRVLDID